MKSRLKGLLDEFQKASFAEGEEAMRAKVRRLTAGVDAEDVRLEANVASHHSETRGRYLDRFADIIDLVNETEKK